MEKTERKSKQFWADNSNGVVVLVTGYECRPNDGYWYVPELGFSGCEGFSLFETKESALNKAITETENLMRNVEQRLARLQEQAKLSPNVKLTRPPDDAGERGEDDER